MRTNSKSRMLLIELLLAVVIFSVCAVVCVGNFFLASRTTEESQNLSYAVLAAQSAAEVFKASSSTEELAWTLDGTVQDGQVIVWLDSQWNVTRQPEESAHRLHITLERRGNVQWATIAVDGVQDFVLSVSKYSPEVMS